MITAGQVAIELRKLADALDAQPDAKIIRPYVFFMGDEKDSFLNTARLLPRPLKKKLDDYGDKYRKIRIMYDTPAISIEASVPQSLTCELVEPAKPAVYRCAPILSDAEEAGVIA
jgi:hypothetical protein